MRRVVAFSVMFLFCVPAEANQTIIAEIRSQTTAAIGKRWADVAVRIAYVESRYNPRAIGPKTKYGRAAGVMQVMPGTARALGFNPKRLTETKYGIAAGVAHMRLCIRSGVVTDAQMAACHLSGSAGWKRTTKSKRQYVALVEGAPNGCKGSKKQNWQFLWKANVC